MIDYKLEKSDDINKCFKNFYEIVSFLRDPKDGCPWDNEQMPVDIIRSMQGEIYEYIDALSEGDTDHQREEIGDIFLNLFLLLKIHDQNKDFKATDALNEGCEKYIRRHPHVFSDVKVENSEHVLSNWQKIKRDVEGRKENPDDFFANIERNAPELERCYKISKKAIKVGFDWDDINGVYDKINEELNEVKNAYNSENLLEELGDVLFTVVVLCAKYKIKPQDALQYANYKFTKRFNNLLKLVSSDNKTAENLSIQEWNDYWDKSKKI